VWAWRGFLGQSKKFLQSGGYKKECFMEAITVFIADHKEQKKGKI